MIPRILRRRWTAGAARVAVPRARAAARTPVAILPARAAVRARVAVPVAMAAVAMLLPWSAAAQGVGLPVGTQAPAAALQDLDGNAVQMLDYVGTGKPTLVEFWAIWCEQCEALQPQLDRIQAEYGDRVNVVAVAVAVSQSERRVRRHLEDHDPGYPFLWDGRGEAVRAYRAPTTAVILLFDGDGRVVYTGAGVDQDLVGEVARVLGASAR